MLSVTAAQPLLQDYLLDSAARAPGDLALVCGGQRWTYGELAERSAALAQALARRGVARGDRVLVLGGNVVETALGFWAALQANAVVSLVHPHTRADKLTYLLSDCEPTAFLGDAALRRTFVEPVAGASGLRAVFVWGRDAAQVIERVPAAEPLDAALDAEAGAPAPPRRALDIDLASIIYTSGSTGHPKGVMLSHRNMLTAATSVSAYLDNRRDEVIGSALPLSFDYGLYQMIMAFREGARLVLEPSFAYPTVVLDTLVRERVTAFPGVPTMFAVLAGMAHLDAWDLGGVRYVTNTAAALPASHIRLVRGAFPAARIYSMYGLTECQRVSWLPPEELERKPRCVGRPIPNTEVWVVDADGRRLGPGEVGELVVRGATVMQGYWRKPEATARRLRPGLLPGERVLYTGDLCRLDDEGDITFVSRLDDIIKCGGQKVAPREVEDALLALEHVVQAAVIGVPDEILGQAIKAFVVLEPGATVTGPALRRQCRQRVEPLLVPAEVVVVDALPQTSSGKVRKQALT